MEKAHTGRERGPAWISVNRETSEFPGLESKEEEPPHGSVYPYLRCSPETTSLERPIEPPLPFQEVDASLWRDWKWQIRHRIRERGSLGRYIRLTEEESSMNPGKRFPLAITPYYLSLFIDHGPEHPLRRCVVPTTHELVTSKGEAEDPLDEEGQSPVPGIVHRYPDRVLFLVTGFCSTYCRYCTRSRVVGSYHGLAGKKRWEQAIQYIEANTAIRDVLISGGDPLTLSDEALGWILKRLRSIRHVEILRIGTKVPAVLPQRITRELVQLLKAFHPLFMSLHFTHPYELTEEAGTSLSMLADAGIPLGSQTVLLKGINDDPVTLKGLFLGLLRYRVRPYYLYQCDPIIGSSHFRTKVEEGIRIMNALRGFISGYAVPTYVIDAPGGGGKVPVDMGTVIEMKDHEVVLKNFEGRFFTYPN